MRVNASPGAPEPLGPTVLAVHTKASGARELDVNLAVHSHAATLHVCLFRPLARDAQCVVRDIAVELPFRARTRAVWHIRLAGVPDDAAYALRAAEHPARLLTDVYAPAIESAGTDDWMSVPGERAALSAFPHLRADEAVRSYISSFPALRRRGVDYPFRPARFAPPLDARIFDWRGTACPRVPPERTIVYEAHVRALSARGTLDAAVDALQYLRWLGVTTVQLLPTFEFAEAEVGALDGELSFLRNDDDACAVAATDPQRRRGNVWGYSPLTWHAPMNRYADGVAGGALALKKFVRAAHTLGIEVVLDVVYNHTANSSCALHFLSVTREYYMRHCKHGGGPRRESAAAASSKDADAGASSAADEDQTPEQRARADEAGQSGTETDGRPCTPRAEEHELDDDEPFAHNNVSACGNTLSPNSPACQALVLSSLRHFVQEYRVDGFRIDAAGVLCRGPTARILSYPPVLHAIAHDPVLKDAKFFVESWDAGDQLGSPNWQLGRFPAGHRLCEWNPRFRDVVRAFWRAGPGDTDMVAFRDVLRGCPSLFADTSGSGSGEGEDDEREGEEREGEGEESAYQDPVPKLKPGRPHGAAHSLNYVSCHDGFSLADVVSYERRTNSDGYDELSFNSGAEGATTQKAVLARRARALRNLMLTLAVARGVPMLGQGDEFGFSKGGNSNSWNDPDVFAARLPGSAEQKLDHERLVEFTKMVFELRKEVRQLTGTDFYERAVWLDEDGAEAYWGDCDSSSEDEVVVEDAQVEEATVKVVDVKPGTCTVSADAVEEGPAGNEDRVENCVKPRRDEDENGKCTDDGEQGNEEVDAERQRASADEHGAANGENEASAQFSTMPEAKEAHGEFGDGIARGKTARKRTEAAGPAVSKSDTEPVGAIAAKKKKMPSRARILAFTAPPPPPVANGSASDVAPAAGEHMYVAFSNLDEAVSARLPRTEGAPITWRFAIDTATAAWRAEKRGAVKDGGEVDLAPGSSVLLFGSQS